MLYPPGVLGDEEVVVVFCAVVFVLIETSPLCACWEGKDEEDCNIMPGDGRDDSGPPPPFT